MSNIKETSNQSFYDQDSSQYDAQRWVSPAGRFTNDVQQSLVAHLCAGWSGRALEIGQGTARFTMPLIKMGMKMTICDLSSQMLEVASGNIREAGLEDGLEQAVEGSIYELPFEDNSFDHSISLNVYNHLEHPEKALSQMARVVRPGGTILINYANLRSWYWPAARRINKRSSAVDQEVYSSWIPSGRMKKAARDAGLTFERRVGHVHVPRGMEKLPLLPVVRILDAVSRRGPFAALASVHFCLFRKPA